MCAESAWPVNAVIIAECRKENLREVHELLGGSPEAASWSGDALEDAFERYPSYMLVAWQGDEIAGFIAGRAIADESEILNLAVKTSCRRQGVGKALVKSLLEVFARAAALQVFLEVRESNAPAIAFYRALEFSDAGRRKGYYHEPEEAALLLSLSIKQR